MVRRGDLLVSCAFSSAERYTGCNRVLTGISLVLPAVILDKLLTLLLGIANVTLHVLDILDVDDPPRARARARARLTNTGSRRLQS